MYLRVSDGIHLLRARRLLHNLHCGGDLGLGDVLDGHAHVVALVDAGVAREEVRGLMEPGARSITLDRIVPLQ